MKEFVKLVKRMDNRNIEGAATQLTLLGADNFTGHNDSLLSVDDINSAGALLAAWEKFSRGKRGRQDVLVYERYLEENVFELEHKLRRGDYRHARYQPFTIYDPKQRNIHKALVEDRLVHQAIVSAIEPLFESRFIYDSFSCRKGKGTHAAVRRLRSFLRRASRNDTKTVYTLKCDIKQFFASVDHQKLLQLLECRITDSKILSLLIEVIKSYETKPGKGIPLGNLTSQLFANIYLHELDWFVKHSLRQKYYARYCDDFVIVGTSREDLRSLIPKIAAFLQLRLELELHPHKLTIRTWRQGVDFLGYVLKPHATMLRTKTAQRMLYRINENNYSSYLGLCSHANAHRLKQLLLTKLWLRGEEDDHL